MKRYPVSAFLAVAAMFLLAACGGGNDSVSLSRKGNDTTTSAPADVGTPTTEPPECNGHDIRLPDRKGGRLNAAGAAKPGDAEAFRAQILDQAAHDPLTLFLYYQASPLGERNPLSNEAVIAEGGKIENGNCYSAEGIRAFDMWSFAWSNLTDIVSVDEITFQGFNTGVSGASLTYARGVGGTDKSGVDITYKDATGKVVKKHSALYRCTQPTGDEVPPGIPEGPTDNPPPDDNPTPTTSPPTTTGGKDDRKSVISDDINDPDERIRPNQPAPPVVIRPPGPTTTQRPPPSTIADPPQVQTPVTAKPGIDTAPSVGSDPSAGGGDGNGDGIPD